MSAFGVKRDYPLLKAMSLLTSKPAADIALAAPASQGRMLTLVPWRGRALVGTSQSQTFAQPSDTGASTAEVETLRHRRQRGLPRAQAFGGRRHPRAPRPRPSRRGTRRCPGTADDSRSARSRQRGRGRGVYDPEREVLERASRRGTGDEPCRPTPEETRTTVENSDDGAPGRRNRGPRGTCNRDRAGARPGDLYRDDPPPDRALRRARGRRDQAHARHARSPRAAGAVDADHRRGGGLRHPAGNGAQAHRHPAAANERRRTRPPGRRGRARVRAHRLR